MHARIIFPLAALAAAAVAFALPPHKPQAHPVSQVQTIDLKH
jgi:hypothetical protein